MKRFLGTHGRLLFISLAVSAAFLWSHVGLTVHLLCGHCQGHSDSQHACSPASEHDCCEGHSDSEKKDVAWNPLGTRVRPHTVSCPVCAAFLGKLHEAGWTNVCGPPVCVPQGPLCALSFVAAIPRGSLLFVQAPRAPPSRNS